MSRLRSQEGMTLTEVLVALTISMIISLATFGLIGTVMARSGDIGARVDTTQRGRSAMDFITRQIRSQVCVQRTGEATDDRAVYAATPLSLTFFSDLGDESNRTGNVIKAPEIRRLTLENGKLMQRAWAGTAVPPSVTGANPTYTYTGYPNSGFVSRQILDGVTTVETTTVGAQPLVFRYYQYNTAKPPRPVLEMDARAGLTTAQLQQVSRITVSFRALRSRAKVTDKTGSTAFSSDIYVRSADPNSTTPKPVCA